MTGQLTYMQTWVTLLDASNSQLKPVVGVPRAQRPRGRHSRVAPYQAARWAPRRGHVAPQGWPEGGWQPQRPRVSV